jgi:hypothetical protein
MRRSTARSNSADDKRWPRPYEEILVSVLAMQNDFFERPFANIIIEWSSRLAQEQRQLPPMI